jgi:NADH-quinone oxidoreductase subunit N
MSLAAQIEQISGAAAVGAAIGWEDVRSVLPVIVLFLTGSIALLLDLFRRGALDAARPGEKTALHFISLLGVVLSAALTCTSFQAGAGLLERTYFSGAIRADHFSSSISLIILAGTFFSLLVAIDYLHRHGIEHGEFHGLVLFAAGGMILFAQANNLITIFLSLETLSMAVYVLSAFRRDEKRSVEGAFKYFVLGAFASGFLLLGMAFLYGATREVELGAMVAALRGPQVDVSLLVAGLALAIVGLAFKVGAFPFHAWVPDAYEGAPAVVTGFMAVTVKAAAFAVLLRLAIAFGPEASPEGVQSAVVSLLAILSAATMIYGNLVALVQASVKRMLAYSAVGHTGYLLAGVVAALSSPAPAESAAAVIFYLIPYSLMTLAAFTLIGVLGRGGEDLETFADYRGLSQARPALAFSLLVVLVSFAGIPPTAGFWGKLYIFREAVSSGHWPLALIGILTSIISLYFYLRLVVSFYMQPLDAEAPPAPEGRTASALVIAAAAVLIVAIGLFPSLWLELSAGAVAGLGK